MKMIKLIEIIGKVKDLLIPPLAWRIPVALILGVLAGSAFFILHISKVTSYLSDDPRVCINCHIMTPEYISWERSSHHNVATCNECHTPQNNIFNHYFFKAKDGLRHSYMFTLRLEPDVIQIHEAGRDVVETNCRRCHASFLSHAGLDQNLAQRRCTDCHRETPHGRVRGLSSTPHAIVPTTGSMAPDWVKKILK